MHLSASTLRFLPPFLIALLLSSAQALPRDAAKQQRLAEYAAQTPLHTTALLAGAAATQIARPAMPTTALRSRIIRPSDDPSDDIDELLKLVEEVLDGRQRIREKLEEYALPLDSLIRHILMFDRHIREIELRESRLQGVGKGTH